MEHGQEDKETLDALLRRAQRPAATAEPGVAAAFEEIDGAGRVAPADWRRPLPDLLKGIQLRVRVELGRVDLPLKKALELGPGAVVDLDKMADDTVDIYVHDLLVARGEVLVLNDCFCVRITEVLAPAGVEEGSSR